MVIHNSVTFFELTDDATDIPDWVKDCLDHPEQMATVTMPLLADELVKDGIFKSKTEFRNAVKNHGVSVFCHEGDGKPYTSVNGTELHGFIDKAAVIDDANIRWSLEDGDIVKTGKRKLFIIKKVYTDGK